MGYWAIQNRFTFNTSPLGKGLGKHYYFEDSDYDPTLWHMALEMGGLYMAYTKVGKNIFSLMIDNDLGSLKRNAELGQIQFQEGFMSELYAVWSVGNQTEVRLVLVW
jgi:hypothetical protein